MIDTLVVIAGPILIVGIILYWNVRQNMDDLRKNWVKYRCSPQYMPFASIIQSEVSTSENFQHCVNAFSKDVFEYARMPIDQLFGMITNAIKPLLDQLSGFLKYLAGMDSFIFTFASSVFGKLGNTMSTFLQQIGHVRSLMERITASGYYMALIVETVFKFVLSIFNFLISLIKSIVIMVFALGLLVALFYPAVLAFLIPLGAMFGLSYSACFHPNTMVETDRGFIRIADLVIGDTLRGSKVLGVMEFECTPDNPLFDYHGTIVSGHHIVNHLGRWMYVKDASSAFPYTGLRPATLICLNTSDNHIRIGSSLFADYEEVSDPDALVQIDKLVWGRRTYYDSTVGLDPCTHVTLRNGKSIEICKLHVGDQLREGKVSGIMVLDPAEMDWVTVRGCRMSASQPVLAGVHSCPAGEIGVSTSPPSYAMQIVIDNASGWFSIDNGLLVRDYPDSHDVKTLDAIQDIVFRTLHKKVATV